jgi:hypothetical protein
MSNFVQDIEYDMYMYAKFENLYVYRVLQLNTPRFSLLLFPTMQ